MPHQIHPTIAGRTLALRPITPADMGFLCQVYGATRTQELAQVPWTDAEKQAFVQMQFDAQHAHYQQHYPRATFEIILLDDQPAGRLYLDWRAREVRIVDIALLPTYRGQGVGTAFIQAIGAAAAAAGLAVTIHVEQFNPARTLYERIGFLPQSEHGMYLLMEWRPTREAYA